MSRTETIYCDVCDNEIKEFNDEDIECVKRFVRSIDGRYEGGA